MFNWFAASLNLTMQSSGFVKFNGFNYAEWAEQIQFQLGVMNLWGTEKATSGGWMGADQKFSQLKARPMIQSLYPTLES